MFQDKNTKEIFHSKHNTKYVDIIQLTTQNTIIDKYNNKLLLRIPIENQLLKYKFVSNTLILLYKAKLVIIPNYKDLSKQINSSLNVNKEIGATLKIYKLSEKWYLILNGKTIYKVECLKNRIEIKIYRQNIISFKKILSYEIKDEFEGDNLFIKCIVTYENNKINDSEVVIQDFILPYLENNLIINYETLSLQLNNQDRILLTTGDGIFYIKENKVLFSYFIQKNQDHEIVFDKKENVRFDKILLIDKIILLFTNSNEIYLYSYDKGLITYKCMILYNSNKDIIMKWNGFILNNNIIIFYLTYKHLLKYCLINTTKCSKENEKEILIEYSFDNGLYNKHQTKINFDGVDVIYINDKICILPNNNIIYYNTIIDSIKKLNLEHYGIILNNKRIDIYNNSFTLKKYEINYSHTSYKIIDYIFPESELFYLLIYDKYDSVYKVIHYSINDNKQKETIVYKTSSIFTSIHYLQELHYIVLFSIYGEILIFRHDEEGCYEKMGEFIYSFSSSEVSELEIEFHGNKEDLKQLFQLDTKNKMINAYELKYIDLIQKEESQLFQFWVIVLCVNCGVINLIVMKNKYTLFEKIIMVNQIKTNIDEFVKGNYNILKSTIQYDIINNKIIFNTKNEK